MIAVIAVVVAILVGGIVVGSFFIVNASWQCGQIQQGNFNVVCTANPTGTSPYSYVWNFGDGSALSYLQNPSHQYSAAGTYTITIQITDGSGSVYKNSMSLCVSDVNGNCPTVTSQGPSFSATISASNMNPTVNQLREFQREYSGRDRTLSVQLEYWRVIFLASKPEFWFSKSRRISGTADARRLEGQHHQQQYHLRPSWIQLDHIRAELCSHNDLDHNELQQFLPELIEQPVSAHDDQ